MEVEHKKDDTVNSARRVPQRLVEERGGDFNGPIVLRCVAAVHAR
jgi:hypothetical protein